MKNYPRDFKPLRHLMISSVELVSLCFLKLEHLPKWLCASKLKRSDGGDGALLNYALARKTICARDFTLPYYYSMIERLSIVFYTILPQRDYFLSSIHCNALRSWSKWRRRWWGVNNIWTKRLTLSSGSLLSSLWKDRLNRAANNGKIQNCE